MPTNATSNLGMNQTAYVSGKDSIVIVNALGDIPGGRTLDCTGFTKDAIQAGHVVIKLASGEYAPMPVKANQDAYASLPEGASYVGVVKASVLKNDPRVAIVTMGQINGAACPFPITADIKKGLPNIQFLHI